MNVEKLKLLLSKKKIELSSLLNHIMFFARQCLGTKKIVIISEKGISSLPVSFKFQASVICGFMVVMLWVSYSTGKYFAYEGIISEKDREIWTSNITNENLQYQVSDLHNNLMELNQYFDNLKQLGQLSDKKTLNNIPASGDKTSSNLSDSKDPGMKGILTNIRTKVLERISSLESLIEMTGIKVNEVAANNSKLRNAIIDKAHDDADNHQGGAFIPVDDQDEFNRDFDKEVSYLMQLEKVISSFPIASPMGRYWVSSEYGTRIDPIRSRVAMHSGIDLVSQDKSKVYSSAPGVVKFAGAFGAYGNFIEIDHGSGITTRYGHLSTISVKRGDKVARGQTIGIQGSSGRSTGTHLHYEVRYNNKSYDPKKFLTAGKYVF